MNLDYTSFHCLHTEATSSGLSDNVKLHKENVYLPKIAPLKRGLGKVWGVRGV